MEKVNLDALIQREDFEVKDENNSTSLSQTIKISDLERDAFFYKFLRKPDFQRETSDWDPQKNLDFIKCFLNEDLIPAIIFWNSGQYTFVIDGAHRLSALLSWVHDDYGDGFISQSFFGHDINDDQKTIAEKTRRLINKGIGAYKTFQESIKNPEKAHPDILKYARKLGYLSLQLQWVKGGAEKAEASFFKINQEATPINETEIELLRARMKPHALSARAIIRSGTGHKYWSKFKPEIQAQIENLAKEINETLFIPQLETPIKTLDLPLAGKGYSANTLSLVYDLVCISNNKKAKDEIPDDVDGNLTMQYLRNTGKLVRRIASVHPSSLGLHPAVYFYSSKGRYQPTAFLAIIELMKEFEQNSSFLAFTKIRADFEDFLIKHKSFINQVTLKHGSSMKGYMPLKNILVFIVD
ncbi:MAG: DUF262 domain-containing protein, partial [Candidatus Omnitrophota bacterium]